MLSRLDETRDGFHLERDKFEYPPDFNDLSAYAKRAATICDLFLNNSYTLNMIMTSLNEDFGSVVRTLIAQGVIKDRRILYGKPPSGKERRSRLPAWLTAQGM